jgi:hypothetical protein
MRNERTTGACATMQVQNDAPHCAPRREATIHRRCHRPWQLLRSRLSAP